MTPDLVFRLSSSTAALSWILLILSTFVTGKLARLVSSVICKYVVPVLLAVVYLAIISSHWAGHEGGFGSVAEVQKLFGNDWLVVAGWVHYLAFDLFVGAWEVRDARRSGMFVWWIIPALVLTFLFGPIGFLLYLLAKVLFARMRKEASLKPTSY